MKIEFKLLIGFILVVGLGLYWFLSGLQDAFSGTYNRIDLNSRDNQRLYIKSHNWGLTGDHQLTVIETDDEREFEEDSTSQITFNGLEPFLWRVSNDTLFLVLRKKSVIPNGFKSTWTMIQNEVDNPTMIGLRRDPEFNRM